MSSSRRTNLADLVDGAKPGPSGEAQQDRNSTKLVYVKTDRLLPNPHNPRDDIGDLEDLKSIAEIQRQSLLVVTRGAYLRLYADEAEVCRGVDYIVANGCRRHAAAVKYGRDELICVVNDEVAQSRASLLRAAYDENVQRRDFDPIEEAKAVMSIVREYPTAKDAAEAQGWTPAWISQRKSLLKIHPELQDLVRSQARGEGGISIRDARRLGQTKGIEVMSVDGQLAALEGIRGEDEKAREAAKAARESAKETGRASTADSGGGFTAVNPEHGKPAAPAGSGQQPETSPASGGGFTAVNPEPSGSPKKSAGLGAEPSGSGFTAVDPEPSGSGVAGSGFTAVNPGQPSGTQLLDGGAEAAETVSAGSEFTAVNPSQPLASEVPGPRDSEFSGLKAGLPVPANAVDWQDRQAVADAICLNLTIEEADWVAKTVTRRVSEHLRASAG